MTTVTNDGLLTVAELLGVQTFPVALAVVQPHDHIDAWRTARREARAMLIGSGVIDDYGDVDAELAGALHVLARPDRQLVARVHRPDGTRRVCLARRGLEHAVAVRSGNEFDIRQVWGDEDHAVLARPLLAALGPGAAAGITAFGGLAGRLRERMDAAHSSGDFIDIAFHFGCAEREAVEFGMAMAGCHTHAEIAAYHHRDGSAIRIAAAVAVYDTARGRIVAAPTQTGDGQFWTTFAPGTDHRVTQSISALIGLLPGERWMP
ncbi:ESX secretion-associated protein EspG [Nocardia sp. NPDC049220]|uniref:ESX secretion-associated protein EspG n=1 Tax=Nocardia sp. NPDC049220 TaxID=3155273 RepID=UPI0033FC68CA